MFSRESQIKPLFATVILGGHTQDIYSKDDGSYIPCWTHFLKKYMILVGQFLFDFITTIYSSVFFSCALKKTW